MSDAENQKDTQQDAKIDFIDDPEKVTYFAETDARNKRVRFGIRAKDRTRHIYTIGKTGMGKSTLLENMAIQDIQNGEGFAFIDPHGKTADLLLEYVPEHRIKDVIYFAPFDLEYPISFNVLEDVGSDRRHLVANGLMSAFKKIWVDAWSARMEYILNNIMLALLEYPGSTLMGVNRMLTDKDFRKTVVDNITDPSVKAFWQEEYAKYTDKFAAEAAPAIQNKVGQFISNPLVRNIVGQQTSSFDIRKVMDDKKILIINLSKGRVGEANANLLGSMLITKIYLAAMSRADLSEKELKKVPQFYLYVDEFQSFANESFADILSEARKYKLNLTIAHQYVEQMTEEVRAAVFGNVGTMIVFRVGAYDASIIEKEFSPEFTAEDIVNLQQYQMYLKLMIDGVTSRPFSGIGMAPIAKPEIQYQDQIIENSRNTYAKPRAEVEEDIRNWHLQKIGGGPRGADNGHGNNNGGGRGEGGGRDGGGREGRRDGGRESGRDSGRGSEYGRRSSSERDRVDRGDRGERIGGGGDRRDNNSNNSNSGNSGYNSGTDRSSDKRNDRNDGDERSDRGERRGDDRNRINNNGNVNNADDRNRSVSNLAPNEHQKDDKEKELRQAISLSYLHKEDHKEKIKNNNKNAKPENLSALREALFAVMKPSEPAKDAAPAKQVEVQKQSEGHIDHKEHVEHKEKAGHTDHAKAPIKNREAGVRDAGVSEDTLKDLFKMD